MSNLVITIDGPAASGKSTAARLLAEKIGASFLDTGAMYRAVTFVAMEAGADLNDENQLLAVLKERQFEFEDQNGIMRTYVDGIDVTERIREPKVTANARYIASAPKIRCKLIEMQRKYAAGYQKVVSEGRDQGTIAFPQADIKFYLTADVRIRAQRRQAELVEKGKIADIEQVQKAIEKRDESDQTREVGPLKPATDAIVIDTTQLGVKQVVEKLFQFVADV
jgi:cytidylate kinase